MSIYVFYWIKRIDSKNLLNILPVVFVATLTALLFQVGMFAQIGPLSCFISHHVSTAKIT